MRGKMAAPAPQEVVIQYVFSKEVSLMLNSDAMEVWATERMVPLVEQMKLARRPRLIVHHFFLGDQL